MPGAHKFGELNVAGAAALTISDRLRGASEQAVGRSGALPAAVVSLHHYREGRPVEVLAGSLGVSHSRAVRVVDQLERAGLARRRPDPDDGRVASVALTPAGRRVAQRILTARAAALDGALAGLSAAERRTFASLAAKVLGDLVGDRADARRICRLCDSHACGHEAGRCPVTRAADRAQEAAS